MIDLKLEKREITGKKAKRLRREGTIPSVIYNRKNESYNAKSSAGDLERVLKGISTTTVLDVNYDGRDLKAFVRDIEKDPITGELIHVSFFEIDPSQKITYELPFTLTGVSPAVKNNIGVLIQPTKAVPVRSKLEDMVDEIKIDISDLEVVGQSILLREIELPEGIEFVQKDISDKAIATISQLQKLIVEEEEEADEDEEAVEGEEGEAAEGETAEGEEGAEGEAAEGETVAEGEAAPEAK
jgi:large subunit ribosomal protein L25